MGVVASSLASAAASETVAVAVAAHGTLSDASATLQDMPDAFHAALQLNAAEHETQMDVACSHYYCGAAANFSVPPMSRWSMGPMPLNDYPSALEGEEQIFVSQEPLFSPAECERIIELSELEGEGLPSSKSGKYKLGKAWIRDMPQVNDWFNEALRTKLFPTLTTLFPTLVSDASVLRAHSVAVLKYNSSHPRTDVHVDDALLAFTVALSAPSSFEGGGTYFEHIDRVVDMAQGHATFRPGGIRHGGHAVTQGLRYVIGGFIAVADKVEHVARLNERGNKLMLQPEPSAAELREAERLFEWGLALNPRCSLCNSNLGDVRLKLDEPERAEAALRAQLALLPRDADAHFGLGVALRAQGRDAEAVASYESALGISPNDFESWSNLAAALGSLGEYEREAAAYRKAVELRPLDVKAWLNLGISRTSAGRPNEAEEAFLKAAEADPRDPRPALNLGRLTASLSRPADSIAHFYDASAINPEYFDEVKMGVGTARAMQGRLAEATEDFRSASRMQPKNEKLKASLDAMAEQAELLAAFSAGLSNRVPELCGTACQDVIDSAGTAVCAISWRDGCGDAPPPEGMPADASVAELCALSCAHHTMQQQAQQPGR